MDGSFEIAINVDLLSKLYKDTGHSRILTDGQILLPGLVQIFLEQAQCSLCQWPRFGQSS